MIRYDELMKHIKEIADDKNKTDTDKVMEIHSLIINASRPDINK